MVVLNMRKISVLKSLLGNYVMSVALCKENIILIVVQKDCISIGKYAIHKLTIYQNIWKMVHSIKFF